ncbi:aminoglycoside phosphotransferase family protein [Aestuariimicrobium ganziense]|uniref:aminoglycoside phosphotransferase family protein n=1 Tax=Aestuariimicrobium ganziense TaxID=2773677 RepID=UPI001940C119|nr:aminoglycoside phosphotransferase family protein [Aestuariimicrobium ganziense]
MTSQGWDDVLADAAERWSRSSVPADAWQRAFPETLMALVHRWGLELEAILPHGGLPVCAVRRPDGQPAVLKLGRPADLNQEAAMFAADGGRSTARLLEHDPDAAAILVERLGRALGDVEPDPLLQCRRLAETLQLWWQVPLSVAPDHSMHFGGSKARGLRSILDEQGPRFGGAAPVAIARARHLADALATDEHPEVVCHGDPHPWNLLEHLDGGWRFVDPDGLLCEKAYDLGVVLRGHGAHVIALERARPGSGSDFLAELAGELGAITGVDVQRILDWAFVERVTTGLYCRMLGHEADGVEHLTAAEVLATA